MTRLAGVATLLVVLCLLGCPAPIRPGSAVGQADSAAGAVVERDTQRSALWNRAVEAEVAAAQYRAIADALRQQGGDAKAAELAAARAEGAAAALVGAAARADAALAQARADAAAAAKAAQQEAFRQANEDRLARVRYWCVLLGGVAGLVGLVLAAVTLRLGHPRAALAIGTAGAAVALLAPTYGAAVPWMEAAAPWGLACLVAGVLVAIAVLARHALQLRTVVGTPTIAQLPEPLKELAAKYGWTI